jgi:hypothetical protein
LTGINWFPAEVGAKRLELLRELVPGAGLLFCFADGLRPHGRFKAQIPAAPGRKARVAELEVRFSRGALCKPRHANAREY